MAQMERNTPTEVMGKALGASRNETVLDISQPAFPFRWCILFLQSELLMDRGNLPVEAVKYLG